MIDIHTTRVQHINERLDLIIPGNYFETITFAVNQIIEVANSYIKKNGFFSIALSGGSTPKAIFEMLTSKSYQNQIDWQKLFIFWSDERSVHPDSSESNYKMAMDAGLKNMPIKSTNIYRMQAEEDISINAEAYENIILKKLNSRCLDFVMLGMGNDGHTASLFPDTKAIHETDKLVVANHIPQKKTWRMTFTLTAINQAKNIVCYVLGESKQNILKKVLFPEPLSKTYPSQLIGSKKKKALIIADTSAVSKLKKAK